MHFRATFSLSTQEDAAQEIESADLVLAPRSSHWSTSARQPVQFDWVTGVLVRILFFNYIKILIWRNECPWICFRAKLRVWECTDYINNKQSYEICSNPSFFNRRLVFFHNLWLVISFSHTWLYRRAADPRDAHDLGCAAVRAAAVDRRTGGRAARVARCSRVGGRHSHHDVIDERHRLQRRAAQRYVLRGVIF